MVGSTVRSGERPAGPRGARRRPGPPPGPWDAGATREAVLAAGAALFAEAGFAGATTAAIAARAGVNKAAIHYHFGTKRRLYEAIVREGFTAFLARLAPLRGSNRPAPERLRRFVEAYAETAGRRPAFVRMFLREVITGGARIPSEVLGYLRGVLALVREIVEAGVRRGEFRPVDPVLTHLGLMGSLAFFFATQAFRQRVAEGGRLPLDPPAARFVDHLLAVMEGGLRSRPRREKTP
jgi:TetR/AcrR family transcriptional regulator